uniref:VCBS domain-containing protein n=1 Tax=Vibrio sp. TaxID=678 RepID=UPI003D0E122D
MNTAILSPFVLAGATIVIDINGQIRQLLPGELPGPGEVIVTIGEGTTAATDIKAVIVGQDGTPENLQLDDEIAQIIQQIELGADPTLNEDQATAAGQADGSSPTTTGAVSRTGAESLASTHFETEGLMSQGLSQTQSLQLLDIIVQNASEPVSDENNAPQGDDVYVETPEDTPVSGVLMATDADGDSLTFRQTSEPSNGSATVNSDGSWTYTPNENYHGSDSFTVEVSDGQGGTDSLVVNIGVTPIDDIPTLTPDTGEVTEDTAAILTTNGTLAPGIGGDAGEDKFIAENGLQGDYGTLDIDADGNWAYQADNSQSAIQDLNVNETLTDQFTVTSADGVTTTTVTITINGVNELVGGDSLSLILDDADTLGNLTDTDTGALQFSAGAADIISFEFGSTDGLIVEGLKAGDSIAWRVDGVSGDLIGSVDNVDLIQLSLDGNAILAGQSGSVTITATLLDNLQHDLGDASVDVSNIVVNAVD